MERYKNLDGFRSIASISIVFMHMLVNNNFVLDNNIFIQSTSKAGVYVQLFFILSAFGMCCGYYEKIKEGTISINNFYKKRYFKLLPFFAILVLIDVMISGFPLNSIYEGFSDLTLLFGLFPASNIEVIGVGWTLGVIFAFYCLFPFFVFTIWTKRRAWISLIISLGINFVCSEYFLVNNYPIRSNFMRWSCYFIVGGIIYLYREEIRIFVSKFKIISIAIVLSTTTIGCLTIDWQHLDKFINTPILLSIFSVWIAYFISVESKLLANKTTAFISDISFEIYLSHMMIYRALEKVNLVYLFGNNTLSYILFTIMVLILSILFSVITKFIIDLILKKISKKISTT